MWYDVLAPDRQLYVFSGILMTTQIMPTVTICDPIWEKRA